MDNQYQKLWILFRERIARASNQEDSYVAKNDVLLALLADMAILEAEVVLED